MSRTFEEVRDQAMQLSMEERSWLADELWESARTAEEREIDKAWEVEIERRVAEIDAGTAKLIPGDEVLRDLRAKYGKRSRRSR
ncbi:MAG: addiction module protein [Acidobacteriota bacterium]|nr:addiction module protein [Acidobacteriota bacterium]